MLEVEGTDDSGYGLDIADLMIVVQELANQLLPPVNSQISQSVHHRHVYMRCIPSLLLPHPISPLTCPRGPYLQGLIASVDPLGNGSSPSPSPSLRGDHHARRLCGPPWSRRIESRQASVAT